MAEHHPRNKHSPHWTVSLLRITMRGATLVLELDDRISRLLAFRAVAGKVLQEKKAVNYISCS